ncbi:Demethylmenaquinone methyltransferase [Podospora conica]|nr:Demethylmenaquinone methyltransferase [Schizothecium conicum]
MSPRGSLEGYEFTFENFLDSSEITADSDQSAGPDLYDTCSLSESIATFRKQFGRTYHSHRAGSYVYPNDETELDRLDEQYELLKEMMDGQLHLAPFTQDHPPTKILDIGTGTGLWAVEMGDEYPSAHIIGTDLSPIQPPLVPPNVRFFVEDSTEDWDYTPDFDYIHTRLTLGCWKDMRTQIIEPAFAHLRPGGWLECQEVVIDPFCDDGTMPGDFGWRAWADEMVRASDKIERQLRIGAELKAWFEEAGFVDVREAVIKIPIGGWAKDIRLKHVGMLWRRMLADGVSGFSLGLFCQVLGRSLEDIEVSLVDIRKSLFEGSVHSYHKLYVVCGRRP